MGSLQDRMLEILVGTFVATSLMTAFSYVYSAMRKKQFREPELLNDLMRRLRWIEPAADLNHGMGWVVHYFVGFFFVTLYYWSGIVNGFWDYVVAGAVCGVVGIAGWHITFTLHPKPPRIKRWEHYVQLFFAHVVFGIGAYLAYIWLT